MKLIYVYAKNLDVFVEAAKDTDCRLNASVNVDYMLSSLSSFNARDVLGLIVFANPMTKKCLKLIKSFDDLFTNRPIIVINDDAKNLFEAGYLRVKSDLFLINSEENSISDVDINSAFATILAYQGKLYDLSVCPLEHKKVDNKDKDKEFKVKEMSEELKSLLESI